MSEICSNLTRCNNAKLIYIEDIYICQNCNNIFQKGRKYIKDILYLLYNVSGP